MAKKLGKTTIERDWLEKKLNSSVSLNEKKLLFKSGLKLSKTRQYELLHLNRTTLYYEAKSVSEYNLKLMNRIDEIYTYISSTYGYRFMRQQLLEDGYRVGVNKVNRLMNVMGIQAISPKKRKLTSIKKHEHTKPLRDHGIQITMNGKGRSIDNIAVERIFRTLKYDDIYINHYQSVRELRIDEFSTFEKHFFSRGLPIFHFDTFTPYC